MPPLPEAIILVLVPFAPLLSHRVWDPRASLALRDDSCPLYTHGHDRLAGDGIGCGASLYQLSQRPQRATWSSRQASRILLGVLITVLAPPEAAIVLESDDTVERRQRRKITAKGCYSDAVRSLRWSPRSRMSSAVMV
jgi:hypothetical protein